MRCAFLCFLLTVLGFAARGEAVLQGIVFFNEVSGRPLAGVTVSAAGANDRVTDSRGMFRLVFPDRKPGQHVRLVVALEGHELVNDVQAEVVTLPEQPDDPSSQRVFLVCRAGERDLWAARYFRLRSEEAIESQFAESEQRIRRAGLEAAAQAREIARLREERDQALANAWTLAEQPPAGLPRDESTMLRDAQRAFLDGRVDEALRMLDEVKIREDLAKAEQDRRKAVDALLLRARLSVMKLDFNTADRLFNEALQFDSGHIQTIYEVASFRFERKRLQDSRPLFDQAAALAKERNDLPLLAMSLNARGLLLHAQFDLPGARASLSNAVQLYHDLAVSNPHEFLADHARALNNLGIVLFASNETTNARTVFQESLRIIKKEDIRIPEVFRPLMAQVLSNLGHLYFRQQNLPPARQAFNKALDILRKLAQAQPNKYRPMLAGTLNNFGFLLRDAGDHKAAFEAYGIALSIFLLLAKESPDIYLHDVAVTLSNIGNLHFARLEYVMAAEAYRKSSEVEERFSNLSASDARPFMATVLHNLGLVLAAQNMAETATNAYTRSLSILRELVQTNPEAFRSQLATALANYGSLLYSKHDFEGAENILAESLGHRRQLAVASPQESMLPLCRALLSLADIISLPPANRDGEAANYVGEAMKMLADMPLGPDRVGLEIWAGTIQKRLDRPTSK